MTLWLIALLVQKDYSWQTGMIGTAIAFGFLFSASVYVVHYRNALAKFRDLSGSTATFHVDEDSFTVESSIGASTLKWSTVKEVWQFQNVWLLMFSKAHFSTLPVANLSPQLRLFIVEHVRAAGGKIS
jgi:hypothetical protein